MRTVELEESNTWIIVTTLIFVFFFFHWNFIYSVTTTLVCNTYDQYWEIDAGNGSVFDLTKISFILIGVWSFIELIKACYGQVSDTAVCIYVNCIVLFCVLASLYCMSILNQSYSEYPEYFNNQLKNPIKKQYLELGMQQNCTFTSN